MHLSTEPMTGPGAALDAGEYFGTAAGARSAGAVTLTLTDYSPGTVVPSHAHAHAYFCYVSFGEFEERGERGSYVATRGAPRRTRMNSGERVAGAATSKSGATSI